MSHYDQQPQLPVAYPPPAAAESYKGPYVMAPPPDGYPTRDGSHQESVSTKTTTRGDGFLKGCLAGLCCCWCLDCCF